MSIALYLWCVCLCCFDKVSVSMTILELALWSGMTFNFWPSFFMDGRVYATTTDSCSAGDQTRSWYVADKILLYFFLSLIVPESVSLMTAKPALHNCAVTQTWTCSSVCQEFHLWDSSQLGLLLWGLPWLYYVLSSLDYRPTLSKFLIEFHPVLK